VTGEQSWVIQTDDLQIGTSLSFDLTDASGQVVLKAGTAITERIKERLLKKNITSVTVRGAGQSESDLAETVLLESFPSATIESIQSAIQSTRQSVMGLVTSLGENQQSLSARDAAASVSQFIESASKNVAATLAILSLTSKVANPDIAERIANLATKMALLSVTMSVVRRDSPTESADIGMAGLLHDCSLLLNTEWFESKSSLRDEAALSEYRRHPIESAELLHGVQGISAEVKTMITQVHEQADGSGYPRGLLLDQTAPGATLLNVAEAYIALTEPIRGEAIVPSDALALLCYHTAQGKFCKTTLQLMINSMSIYPVGSTVILDDDSKGVVVEGNIGSPLMPTIRLLNNAKTRIDLRDSKRSVLSPFISEGRKAERIKKTQMPEMLWRTDR
jgi:HD-GYP domain-containing protein (c-di-GMP phosphodiesterase class II)